MTTTKAAGTILAMAEQFAEELNNGNFSERCESRQAFRDRVADLLNRYLREATAAKKNSANQRL